MSLLNDSKVSLLAIDGNMFNQKQFEQLEGYEKVIFSRKNLSYMFDFVLDIFEWLHFTLIRVFDFLY